MKSDNSGSAGNSAAASSRPQPKPSNLSEADYLAHQGEQAKAAMGRLTTDMGECLRSAANLPGWISEFPWTSMAAAAAAGFVVASALTPSRDESFRERLESLIEEVKSHSAVAAATAPTKESEAKTRSLAGGLLTHLMGVVQTVLVSTISSAVSAKVQQTAHPDNGNGEARAPEDSSNTI